MTVEKYRPTKLDDALARIAEECSEVIKILCKAHRTQQNYSTFPQSLMVTMANTASLDHATLIAPNSRQQISVECKGDVAAVSGQGSDRAWSTSMSASPHRPTGQGAVGGSLWRTAAEAARRTQSSRTA